MSLLSKRVVTALMGVWIGTVGASQAKAGDEFGTKAGRYFCEKDQSGGDGKHGFKYCLEKHRIKCPDGYARSAVDGADMCTKPGEPTIGASCETGKPAGTQKVQRVKADKAKGEIDLCSYEMPISDRAGCDEGKPQSLGSDDEGILGLGDERTNLGRFVASVKLHNNGWTCVVVDKGKSYKIIKPKVVKMYNGKEAQ